jgi:NTP pyrophosphatase (non-canonical NTP hydrolase)
VESVNQQLRLEVATLRRRLENSLNVQKEQSVKLDRVLAARLSLVEEARQLRSEVETLQGQLESSLEAEQKFSYLVRSMMNTDNSEAMVLSNIGMGLAGEAGEVVDILKKVVHHGHELDGELRTKLCTEVGDMLFYVEALFQFLDIKKYDCYALVETKLRKRYSKGKFNSEDSINRTV